VHELVIKRECNNMHGERLKKTHYQVHIFSHINLLHYSGNYTYHVFITQPLFKICVYSALMWVAVLPQRTTIISLKFIKKSLSSETMSL